MNQTRNFLLFALLAVAYFLFMAWEKDYMTPPPPAPAASSSAANAASTPGVPNAQGAGTPAISNANAAPSEAAAPLVTVTTDVLQLTIDTPGGSLVQARRSPCWTTATPITSWRRTAW